MVQSRNVSKLSHMSMKNMFVHSTSDCQLCENCQMVKLDENDIIDLHVHRQVKIIITSCHLYGSLCLAGVSEGKRATDEFEFGDETSCRSYKPFSSTGNFSEVVGCGVDIIEEAYFD